MANIKAQAAKDKGNAAFKAGDYPSAIGHYTQAILDDRKDFTFPLNRAAAYLKLGKYEDAERDCTTVLSLSASNVKALFRRGQARIGMGNLVTAEKDFEEAAKLEPNNQAVQSELDDLKNRRRDKNKQDTTSDTVHPARRRVPIKIIEPVSGVSKSDPAQVDSSSTSPGSIQEVDTANTSSKTANSSSHQKNVASASTSAPPAAPPSPSPTINGTKSSGPSGSSPPPKSFQDAKRAREESKTSRVGGGIFRASGKNTIFPTRETSSPVSASNLPSQSPTPVHEPDKPPYDPVSDLSLGTKKMSLFDFTREWDRLGKGDIEEKFQLIVSIAPSSYRSMFQNSLEPAHLVGLVEVFQAMLKRRPEDETIRKVVTQCMAALARVPRIGMVVLLLTQREKSVIAEVIGCLEEEEVAVWKGILKI